MTNRTDSFLFDLRNGLRALLRSPGYTIVALATLALGIGANSALFSVVNAALIRPLPYPEPDRLVEVQSTVRGTDGAVSPPDFLDWRTRARSFTAMVAMDQGSAALSGDGPAEQLQVSVVSDGFFRVTGVEPALGRGFTVSETQPGNEKVAILSDDLWRSRFGADRRILGKSIRLGGDPYVVVGVMPKGFAYPSAVDLWTPLAFDPMVLTQRGAHYLTVVGRLKPGVTVDAATRDMQGIAAQIGAENPNMNIGWGARAVGLRDAIMGDVQPALLVLLGAVGFVLLIACVNVASLLLARGTARAREYAVRAALGASAGRLASGVLAESLWLGLGGSLLGLLVAAWGTSVVISLAPDGIPGIHGARLDATVLAVTLIAGVLTSVLFGLLPSLRAARHAQLADRLRDGGAAMGGRHGRRSRQALVTAEVALAVVLVVGAGLLFKSFVKLRDVDPGFDPRGVLTFDVQLPQPAYTNDRSRVFFAGLIDQVRALPGVQSAGAIFGLPLRDFGYGITVHSIDGRDLSPQEQENGVIPEVRVVTRDFFRTLAIAPVEGRLFTADDRPDGPAAVVLSAGLAKRLFGTQDPIGHRFDIGTRLGLGKDAPRVGGTVVGVVPDLHDVSLSEAGRPWMYVLHDQFPVPFMSLVVRADDARLPALIEPLKATVAGLDPDVPVYHVRTMYEWVSASMAAQRFYATLIAVFAALALGLAAVGVYGVLSQAVGERTREIGLRVALGAAPGQVTSLVVRQGLAPAAVGLGAGLVLALAVTRVLARWMAPMMFHTSAADPLTYVAISAVVAAVALLAAWVPARRAVKVDPLVALRAD